MAGSVCFPSAPSFVFSFELFVLTMLTEKFFLVILGPTDVTFRCDELHFVFDSVALFSAIGTLLCLMIFIYNYFYLQYYYLQNPNLKIIFFNDKYNNKEKQRSYSL